VNELPQFPYRYLVAYINPFSGRGKSMQIYKEHVKPMFAEADITCKTIKTGK